MSRSPFLPIPEPRRSSQHLPLRVISVSESRAVRCIIEVSAPCTHGLLCGVMFRWVDVFLLITIWRSNPELPAYWEAADVFGFKSLGANASITVGCLASLFHSTCLDNIKQDDVSSGLLYVYSKCFLRAHRLCLLRVSSPQNQKFCTSSEHK